MSSDIYNLIVYSNLALKTNELLLDTSRVHRWYTIQGGGGNGCVRDCNTF